MAIVVLWKPYYLFSAGFNEPISEYWKNVFKNYAVSMFSFGISLFFTKLIPFNPYNNIYEWIGYATITMCIFLVIEITANILIIQGAKDIALRISKSI